MSLSGGPSGSERVAPRFTLERAPADEPGRRAFARRVVDHLAGHEAENNLPIGVVDAIAAGLPTPNGVELLLAYDASGASRAALVMTPPYRLIVAYGDDPAAREVLLEDMRARRAVPPGVVGVEPEAAEVARWWAEREGLEVRRRMRQGAYRLTRVRPAERTPGEVRVATADDAPVVVPWLEAFHAEAWVDLRSAEETYRSFVESDYRRLYLFEVDGVPVSMSGLGGRTPRGRRIGPVYTPPEHRRRGYAESLVARVSESVLADGNEFCFLYTDLANPTSNAVYERIGYEMIAESTEYDLTAVDR